MKKQNKLLALLLSVLMISSSLPVLTCSATVAQPEFYILTAQDFTFNLASEKLDVSVKESDTDGEYMHLVAAPGTYQNHQIMFSVFNDAFASLEYPYVVFEYRTNSQSQKVSIGQVNAKGENWMSSAQQQNTAGAWSSICINLNDINANTTKNLPTADEVGVQITVKPWGAHNKTLETEQYYDLRFVAYFKTEEEAKAFKYDPNGEYTSAYDPEFVKNLPYKHADKDLLDKYMNEAHALENEIRESKTNVEYTGTAYYIASKGDDRNDGLTPATAWKSALKVSKAGFLKKGDAVFFERGGSYRYEGTLETVAGVTYSAYGSGAKPKLIGSLDASAPAFWEKTEYPDVYRYTRKLSGPSNDVGVIVFDMGRAWGIKLAPGLYVGANSNGLATIDSTGSHSISSPADIDGDLEFWHDWDTGYVYLCSKEGNPGDRFNSVEIVDKGNGIGGKGNYVTIDNLDLFGFGSHGIGYGSTNNLTVQYCSFSFIGGSRQYSQPDQVTRFGNAVEIYGSGKNFTIAYCVADNVYDCCWTIQFQGNSNGKDIWFDNIEFHHNVASYSNTGLEVWLNNRPEYKNNATYGMRDIYLHDNYTYYNGYGWSQQRPNKNGNNFYGDPSITTTVYEGKNSVNNNVGIFPSYYVNYLRYLGADYYNFNNNVYFQHNDRYIGGIPTNPAESSGAVKLMKYDYNTMLRLLATGMEPGSVYYYAEPDELVVPQYTPKDMSFADVSLEHWAYDYINTAVMRGYMNGISTLEFAPGASMTRAMLATVLSRITTKDTITTDAPYTDVNKSAWYINSVNWAYSAGLIDKDETAFRPDSNVTREELADMLYRMLLSEHRIKSYEGKALSFSDAASVTPKYAAGVAFATENGIISGYTDGSVKPKNSATRAEVATMIKRFIDLYHSLDIDYNAISDATDSIIFTETALSGIMSNLNTDKHVTGGYLNISPNSTFTNSDISFTLYERLSKIDLAKYPFVKIRVKSTSPEYSVYFKRNGNDGSKQVQTTPNTYTDTVFCLYDLIKPGSAYDTAVTDGTIKITPWPDKADLARKDTDLFDIEYIGFFPTEDAANAYESELEKNGVKVEYLANGEIIDTVYMLPGSKLEAPARKTSIFGYEVTGWDVPFGTVINTDTAVNAVLEKVEGLPVALFSADKCTFKALGGLSYEMKTEGTKNYVRFASQSFTSNDNTRAYVMLPADDYDMSVSRYMKIGFRISNANSQSLGLNFHPDASPRLWGPKLPLGTKDEWQEVAVDLSEFNYSGGDGGVQSGLTSSDYFAKYMKGDMHSILFKPYNANGLPMKADEYFDVMYIAFFNDLASAQNYSYMK